MPIDDEDILFWRDAVQNVAPMSPVPVIGGKPAPKIRINEHRYYAVRQDFSTYSKALEDMEFGGIDRATLRKFKKEEFAVEAVLDLHGLTEDAAFVKVDEFIPRCFAQGKRCVVIVTGKGYHQAEDDIFAVRGVLRHQVPQWLNLPRLRAMIMIYKHPSERMGGKGALYILLKRKKSF
ncbi:MAG: Smr/MutS family protein [Alphaproteobacteria bacterium]|nr:Smr/MutS family protein [Alphaproteobacteria bacterium]